LERTDDQIYMRRCIDLAERALGFTWPNPVVGSVIVYNQKIIGEGYHLKAGGSHAEVLAIESVTDRTLLRESTMYVNLEPCSHYGKTPPCSARIISEGIPRVVIGTTDTSSRVSGRGIAMLREAGVDVVTNVCEEESRDVNRRFFTFHEKRRPYVILKWAKSADGFIDVIRPAGTPVGPWWITGMAERILVHRWRSHEEAILAGGATIRADNPMLNVRYWRGRNPIRLVVSRSANLDRDSAVFSGEVRTILYTALREAEFPNTETIILDCEGTELPALILDDMYSRGVSSLFVEGGRAILEMFAESGLWDEARVFTGKNSWHSGLPAPAISGKPLSSTSFKHSTLEVFRNMANG
jgi:diaminohydroxyphosphoribosylaminopyrimidine deaminase / 5-amino-6-(5-phosphoribosylamino)uracil reductase